MLTQDEPPLRFVVLVCANAEWEAIKSLTNASNVIETRSGEAFLAQITLPKRNEEVVFFHTGWGKISAAAGCQYAIDTWNPEYLINLGTCGGIRGLVKQLDIVLVDKTVVYDIETLIGDPEEEIRHYTVDIDLSWLSPPRSLFSLRTIMLSADRDLSGSDIATLRRQYNAVAADWESASIAYVAAKNKTKCLILRGVSDLVDETGGEADGTNLNVYVNGAASVMRILFASLPKWLDQMPNH